MTKCVFCGREEHSFKGVHLIKNDGTIDFFCSSKCRKNTLKLKRDKRKLKWTEAYKLSLHKTRAKASAKKEADDAKEASKKETKKEVSMPKTNKDVVQAKKEIKPSK